MKAQLELFKVTCLNSISCMTSTFRQRQLKGAVKRFEDASFLGPILETYATKKALVQKHYKSLDATYLPD